MTDIALVAIILVFIAAVYAISKGFGVKAALKWLGLSLSFEAEKRDRRS